MKWNSFSQKNKNVAARRQSSTEARLSSFFLKNGRKAKKTQRSAILFVYIYELAGLSSPSQGGDEFPTVDCFAAKAISGTITQGNDCKHLEESL
ncbi:hypothetical protein [Brevibacillus gelatini]|uniref:hypothetical protein n=1 Tax=Brevibacillus gelatini TaxID=1655277 RepID=UPI0011CE3D53|nr:hypothetical protein [Brevibacillus gelatini]